MADDIPIDERNAALEARDVVKVYGAAPGGVTALDRVSLAIGHNEFFTLLGPSGCGKTSLLRLFAGFETLTSGRIYLYGRDIRHLPPNKRPINTVFQQYALFPHMSIVQNVMFGLRMLGQSPAAQRKRADEMLELVQLGRLRDRSPAQLSGGQQQRVALARALAPAPRVLLLDEPLSALDLKLRQAMRVELKQIQEDTGITFVFVTHDQQEALTMSDRIAVMSAGELQQTGSARDIYEQPRNRFVADFIGETNLLAATVEEVDGAAAVCRLANGMRLRCCAPGAATTGSTVQVSIRPERISLAVPANRGALTATIERFVYLGTDLQCFLRLDDGTEIAIRTRHAYDTGPRLSPGDRVGLDIDQGAARLLVD